MSYRLRSRSRRSDLGSRGDALLLANAEREDHS
jgi:hypothetical protein